MNETRKERYEFLRRNRKIRNILRKYPVWNGNGKIISTMFSKVDDGVPTLRLEEGWEDYRNLLATRFFQERRDRLIFRGQRHYTWKLDPVLWRGRDGNAKLPEYCEKCYRMYLAETQLTEFRKRLRNRGDYNIRDIAADDLWAIGQHQFLDTPLLDWTFSPYVALYFAFRNENNDQERDPLDDKYNHYRVIYVLDSGLCRKLRNEPKTIQERSKESDDIKESSLDILLIQPKEDLHGRLISQDGLFTFGPYEGTLTGRLQELAKNEAKKVKPEKGQEKDKEPWSHFFKILIPNRDGAREACLKDLMWMNVHPGALFPDIYGATQHCNLSLDFSLLLNSGKPFPTRRKGACRRDYLVEHCGLGKNNMLEKITGQETDWPQSLFIDKDRLDLELLLILKEKFFMGQTADDPYRENDKTKNERPQHQVYISKSFYLGKYPVTRWQWRAVMGEADDRGDAFHGPMGHHPVVNVTWHDAKKFIEKLNEKMGKDMPLRFRLPSEAEWEYACRAGQQTTWPWGDDEKELGKYAWFAGNSDGRTHRVGVKAPNHWGLHDILGNVWEWMEDYYDAGYYQKCKDSEEYKTKEFISDPAGLTKEDLICEIIRERQRDSLNPTELPKADLSRVVHGGSWSSVARRARPAARYVDHPGERLGTLGFRLACSVVK